MEAINEVCVLLQAYFATVLLMSISAEQTYMMCEFLVWVIRIQLVANLLVILRGLVLGIKESMKERLLKKYGMLFGDLKKKRDGKYKLLTQEEIDIKREKKEAKIARREAKLAEKKRRKEELRNMPDESVSSRSEDDEEADGETARNWNRAAANGNDAEVASPDAMSPGLVSVRTHAPMTGPSPSSNAENESRKQEHRRYSEKLLILMPRSEHGGDAEDGEEEKEDPGDRDIPTVKIAADLNTLYGVEEEHKTRSFRPPKHASTEPRKMEIVEETKEESKYQDDEEANHNALGLVLDTNNPKN